MSIIQQLVHLRFMYAYVYFQLPARGYGFTIRKARPSKAGFLLFDRDVFLDVLRVDLQIDDRSERA